MTPVIFYLKNICSCFQTEDLKSRRLAWTDWVFCSSVCQNVQILVLVSISVEKTLNLKMSCQNWCNRTYCYEYLFSGLVKCVWNSQYGYMTLEKINLLCYMSRNSQAGGHKMQKQTQGSTVSRSLIRSKHEETRNNNKCWNAAHKEDKTNWHRGTGKHGLYTHEGGETARHRWTQKGNHWRREKNKGRK